MRLHPKSSPLSPTKMPLKKRFAEKRDVIRRLARQALEEDARGETVELDDLL